MTPFVIGGVLGMLTGIVSVRLLNATGAILLPALLLITSILCGMSGNMEMLGFFRFVQGLTAGLLTTYCFIVAATTFSRETIAALMGGLLAPLSLTGAVGPIVGGLLADGLTWQWSFFATAIASALALAFVLLAWPEWKQSLNTRQGWGRET